MQKPNAASDYQQNLLERLLLKNGWRFRGLQLFSTAPWKAWSFFLLVLIIGGGVYLSFLANDVDLRDLPNLFQDQSSSSPAASGN